MKCVFCNNEIDELKEIHINDAYSRSLHHSELEKWNQITVIINRNGGSEELIKGHVCPKENISSSNIKLVKTK